MVRMARNVRERQPLSSLVAMAMALLIGLAAHPIEVAAQACPTTLRYEEAPANLDFDIGWTGHYHDQNFVNLVLTLGVSGCASPTVPCGECNLAGPVSNAPLPPGPDNQRCVGDTAISCTSDPICGANAPCHFFFDTPIPISKAGVAICLLNDITGAITGTTNLDDGSVAVTVPLRSGVYLGTAFDVPCPLCNLDPVPNDSIEAGICSSGAHAGAPCDSNGTTVFGDVSYDCPPSPGDFLGYIRTADMDFTTGLVTATVTAASPGCTDVGGAGLKCLCDTCQQANAAPCMTNADCNPGRTCGGLRCLAGTLLGDPCTTPGPNIGECGTGGSCGRPGTPTLPNACSDMVCTPNTPPDNDSINEGICGAGPLDNMCFPTQTFRPCTTNPDCTFPGDTCVAMLRQCFTDNGTIGGTVSAVGTANVPIADTAQLAWASLFCLAPTLSSAVNSTSGLPGLGRISRPGPTPTPTPTVTPTPVGKSKCLAGKNKCLSKKLSALYKCHIKAELHGVPPDPACLAKADAKFMACFAKMDGLPDCLTIGDSAAIENKADAFTLDVVAELDPTAPAPNPCAAKKKKCVLKKLSGILKCYEKAAKNGVAVDQKCVDKLRVKFDGSLTLPPDPSKGCFEKIEAHPGCTTFDDTQAIEAKVDSFIEDVLCELGQAPQMCVIQQGDDPWVTPPGSSDDFSGNPIPANFFDPNSDPFSGVVTLRGTPLSTNPPGALGSNDTLVRRPANANLPRAGDTTNIPIEIVALNLVSTNPITVTYNGGLNPEPWDVRVNVSSAAPQQQGSMAVTRTAAEGGTFDTNLPVIPKLTFTRQSDSAVRTLDCGLGGCGGPIALQGTLAPWTATGLIGAFDQATIGLAPVPPGVGVDGDGNGTFETTTIGNPNFRAGVDPQTKACERTKEESQLESHGVTILCEDHYVLYEATGPAGPIVSLDDQFGPPEFPVNLGPVEYLMVPTHKLVRPFDPAAIAHPDAHQLCYDLPPVPFSATVNIHNQFGDQTLSVMNPNFLAVPSEKKVQPDPLPGSPVPLDVNHFKCYDATGTFGNAGFLVDQFGRKNGSIGNPIFFCNPVDKNGEGILDNEMHLTCYEFSATPVNKMVNIRNQFGISVANVIQPKALCVPTEKISFF